MSAPRAIPRDGIDAWLHDIEFLKEVASPSALDLGEAERRTLVPSDRVPVGPSGKELSHVVMALLKPRQHAIGAPDAVLEMPQVSFRDSVPPLVADIAATASWARTAGDPAVHGFEVLTKMRYNLLAKAYVLRAREDMEPTTAEGEAVDGPGSENPPGARRSGEGKAAAPDPAMALTARAFVATKDIVSAFLEQMGTTDNPGCQGALLSVIEATAPHLAPLSLCAGSGESELPRAGAGAFHKLADALCAAVTAGRPAGGGPTPGPAGSSWGRLVSRLWALALALGSTEHLLFVSRQLFSAGEATLVPCTASLRAMAVMLLLPLQAASITSPSAAVTAYAGRVGACLADGSVPVNGHGATAGGSSGDGQPSLQRSPRLPPSVLTALRSSKAVTETVGRSGGEGHVGLPPLADTLAELRRAEGGAGEGEQTASLPAREAGIALLSVLALLADAPYPRTPSMGLHEASEERGSGERLASECCARARQACALGSTGSLFAARQLHLLLLDTLANRPGAAPPEQRGADDSEGSGEDSLVAPASPQAPERSASEEDAGGSDSPLANEKGPHATEAAATESGAEGGTALPSATVQASLALKLLKHTLFALRRADPQCSPLPASLEGSDAESEGGSVQKEGGSQGGVSASRVVGAGIGRDESAARPAHTAEEAAFALHTPGAEDGSPVLGRLRFLLFALAGVRTGKATHPHRLRVAAGSAVQAAALRVVTSAFDLLFPTALEQAVFVAELVGSAHTSHSLAPAEASLMRAQWARLRRASFWTALMRVVLDPPDPATFDAAYTADEAGHAATGVPTRSSVHRMWSSWRKRATRKSVVLLDFLQRLLSLLGAYEAESQREGGRRVTEREVRSLVRAVALAQHTLLSRATATEIAVARARKAVAAAEAAVNSDAEAKPRRAPARVPPRREAEEEQPPSPRPHRAAMDPMSRALGLAPITPAEGPATSAAEAPQEEGAGGEGSDAAGPESRADPADVPTEAGVLRAVFLAAGLGTRARMREKEGAVERLADARHAAAAAAAAHAVLLDCLARFAQASLEAASAMLRATPRGHRVHLAGRSLLRRLVHPLLLSVMGLPLSPGVRVRLLPHLSGFLLAADRSEALDKGQHHTRPAAVDSGSDHAERVAQVGHGHASQEEDDFADTGRGPRHGASASHPRSTRSNDSGRRGGVGGEEKGSAESEDSSDGGEEGEDVTGALDMFGPARVGLPVRSTVLVTDASGRNQSGWAPLAQELRSVAHVPTCVLAARVAAGTSVSAPLGAAERSLAAAGAELSDRNLASSQQQQQQQQPLRPGDGTHDAESGPSGAHDGKGRSGNLRKPAHSLSSMAQRWFGVGLSGSWRGKHSAAVAPEESTGEAWREGGKGPAGHVRRRWQGVGPPPPGMMGASGSGSASAVRAFWRDASDQQWLSDRVALRSTELTVRQAAPDAYPAVVPGAAGPAMDNEGLDTADPSIRASRLHSNDESNDSGTGTDPGGAGGDAEAMGDDGLAGRTSLRPQSLSLLGERGTVAASEAPRIVAGGATSPQWSVADVQGMVSLQEEALPGWRRDLRTTTALVTAAAVREALEGVPMAEDEQGVAALLQSPVLAGGLVNKRRIPWVEQLSTGSATRGSGGDGATPISLPRSFPRDRPASASALASEFSLRSRPEAAIEMVEGVGVGGALGDAAARELKTPAMHRMLLRRAECHAAARACFAVLLWHSPDAHAHVMRRKRDAEEDGPARDLWSTAAQRAWHSALDILLWMNRQRQGAGRSYADLSDEIKAKARLLLRCEPPEVPGMRRAHRRRRRRLAHHAARPAAPEAVPPVAGVGAQGVPDAEEAGKALLEGVAARVSKSRVLAEGSVSPSHGGDRGRDGTHSDGGDGSNSDEASGQPLHGTIGGGGTSHVVTAPVFAPHRVDEAEEDGSSTSSASEGDHCGVHSSEDVGSGRDDDGNSTVEEADDEEEEHSGESKTRGGLRSKTESVDEGGSRDRAALLQRPAVLGGSPLPWASTPHSIQSSPSMNYCEMVAGNEADDDDEEAEEEADQEMLEAVLGANAAPLPLLQAQRELATQDRELLDTLRHPRSARRHRGEHAPGQWAARVEGGIRRANTAGTLGARAMAHAIAESHLEAEQRGGVQRTPRPGEGPGFDGSPRLSPQPLAAARQGEGPTLSQRWIHALAAARGAYSLRHAALAQAAKRSASLAEVEASVLSLLKGPLESVQGLFRPMRRRRLRARLRLYGLRHLEALLHGAQDSDARRLLLTALAAAFERADARGRLERRHVDTDVEGSGRMLSRAVNRQHGRVLYFALRAFDRAGPPHAPAPPGAPSQRRVAILERIVALYACATPPRADTTGAMRSIGLLRVLRPLVAPQSGEWRADGDVLADGVPLDGSEQQEATAAACQLAVRARADPAHASAPSPIPLAASAPAAGAWFGAEGSAGAAVAGHGTCVFTVGQNSFGELMTRDLVPRATPVQVEFPGSEDVVEAVAGNEFTAVRTVRGSVLACGANKHGACAVGQAVPSLRRPTPVAGPSAGTEAIARLEASKGCEHLAALVEASGELLVAGHNAQGQLGRGDGSNALSPVPVGAPLRGLRVHHIATGPRHAIAVAEGNRVFAWGSNGDGQLGVGFSSSQERRYPTPVEALDGKEVRHVAAGAFHSAAVLGGGAVMTWGRNTSGQLGIAGAPTVVSVPTRVALPKQDDVGAHKTNVRGLAAARLRAPQHTAVRVLCGSFHTAALSDVGALLMWGRNSDGQCGSEARGSVALPSAVVVGGSGDRVHDVALGAFFSLAATADGDAYAWGRNDQGQLGVGDTERRTQPTRVAGPLRTHRVVRVAAGSTHSVFLAQAAPAEPVPTVGGKGSAPGSMAPAWQGGGIRSVGVSGDGGGGLTVETRDSEPEPFWAELASPELRGPSLRLRASAWALLRLLVYTRAADQAAAEGQAARTVREEMEQEDGDSEEEEEEEGGPASPGKPAKGSEEDDERAQTLHSALKRARARVPVDPLLAGAVDEALAVAASAQRWWVEEGAALQGEVLADVGDVQTQDAAAAAPSVPPAVGEFVAEAEAGCGTEVSFVAALAAMVSGADAWPLVLRHATQRQGLWVVARAVSGCSSVAARLAGQHSLRVLMALLLSQAQSPLGTVDASLVIQALRRVLVHANPSEGDAALHHVLAQARTPAGAVDGAGALPKESTAYTVHAGPSHPAAWAAAVHGGTRVRTVGEAYETQSASASPLLLALLRLAGAAELCRLPSEHKVRRGLPASRGPRVVASECVALLRALLEDPTWSGAVREAVALSLIPAQRVMLFARAAAGPVGPAAGAHPSPRRAVARQMLAAMFGALGVLGGHSEALRVGIPVLVQPEGGVRQEGTLRELLLGATPCATVRVRGGIDRLTVEREEDLTAESPVEVPVRATAPLMNEAAPLLLALLRVEAFVPASAFTVATMEAEAAARGDVALALRARDLSLRAGSRACMALAALMRSRDTVRLLVRRSALSALGPLLGRQASTRLPREVAALERRLEALDRSGSQLAWEAAAQGDDSRGARVSEAGSRDGDTASAASEGKESPASPSTIALVPRSVGSRDGVADEAAEEEGEIRLAAVARQQPAQVQWRPGAGTGSPGGPHRRSRPQSPVARSRDTRSPHATPDYESPRPLVGSEGSGNREDEEEASPEELELCCSGATFVAGRFEAYACTEPAPSAAESTALQVNGDSTGRAEGIGGGDGSSPPAVDSAAGASPTPLPQPPLQPPLRARLRRGSSSPSGGVARASAAPTHTSQAGAEEVGGAESGSVAVWTATTTNCARNDTLRRFLPPEAGQERALAVGPDGCIAFQHGLAPAPGGVYVNQYTLVMDVLWLERERGKAKADEFIPLLSTDLGAPAADWYLRGDGRVGCLAYSMPGTVVPGRWHRLVHVADLGVGSVAWFVDGVEVSRIRDGSRLEGQEGAEGGSGPAMASVLSDDRWALTDTAFLVREPDAAMRAESTLLVASVQVRPYAMSEEEVHALGDVAPPYSPAGPPSPPPPPTVKDLTSVLARRTSLPEQWCLTALSAAGQRLGVAHAWLVAHRRALRQLTLDEGRRLARFGFPLRDAVQAVQMAGSREGAVALLVEDRAAVEEAATVLAGDTEVERLETGLEEEDRVRDVDEEPREEDMRVPPVHPGTLVEGVWQCCRRLFPNAPGCTSADGGRVGGPLYPQARVCRGPHWNWDDQDGGGFGTVLEQTSWAGNPGVGARVQWDAGHVNVYRWGFRDQWDLRVIAEESEERAPTGAEDAAAQERYETERADQNPMYRLRSELSAESGRQGGRPGAEEAGGGAGATASLGHAPPQRESSLRAGRSVRDLHSSSRNMSSSSLSVESTVSGVLDGMEEGEEEKALSDGAASLRCGLQRTCFAQREVAHALLLARAREATLVLVAHSVTAEDREADAAVWAGQTEGDGGDRGRGDEGTARARGGKRGEDHRASTTSPAAMPPPGNHRRSSTVGVGLGDAVHSLLGGQDGLGGRHFLRNFLRVFGADQQVHSLWVDDPLDSVPEDRGGDGVHSEAAVTLRTKLVGFLRRECSALPSGSSVVQHGGDEAVTRLWRRSIARVLVQEMLHQLVLVLEDGASHSGGESHALTAQAEVLEVEGVLADAGPVSGSGCGVRDPHTAPGPEQALTWRYSPVWRAGDGTVSVWRPRTRRCFVALGDVVVRGRDPPSFPTVTLRLPPGAGKAGEEGGHDGAPGSAAKELAPCMSVARVWTSAAIAASPSAGRPVARAGAGAGTEAVRPGSGRGSFWAPVPHDGFVATGHLASTDPHALGAVERTQWCLQWRLARRVTHLGSKLWAQEVEPRSSRDAWANTPVTPAELATVSLHALSGSQGMFVVVEGSGADSSRPDSGVWAPRPLVARTPDRARLALVMWLLRLLIDFDATLGLRAFAPLVFRQELVTALLRLVEQAKRPKQRLHALGVLGSALRRTPASVLQATALRRPLEQLRDRMERLFIMQSGKTMYSAHLQALASLLVGLRLREAEERGATLPAGLRCELPWFEALVEVAAVMEALAHRKRRRLPTSFILAEDMFLPLLLMEEMVVIESDHPYDRERRLTGEVIVPHAKSLEVRFDERCQLASPDTLELYSKASSERPAGVFQVALAKQAFQVQGNLLRYRFPIPSSFNWSLDPFARGPAFQLDETARSARYMANKTWQSVFATAHFTTGIASWEARVDHTTSAGNIFFGVVLRGAPLDAYVGKNSKGWGWIGCKALWHSGRAVTQGFGSRLRTGDVVTVTLDLVVRTLSIRKNGVDFGVAFRNLPPGRYYPAFSIYNRGDAFTLLNGTKASSSGVARPLVAPEPQVPPHRQELAQTLSNMGFSVPMCVKALAATEDSLELAADYLLVHASELEAEVEAEEAQRARVRREQQHGQEQNWVMSLGASSGGTDTEEGGGGSSASGGAGTGSESGGTDDGEGTEEAGRRYHSQSGAHVVRGADYSGALVGGDTAGGASEGARVDSGAGRRAGSAGGDAVPTEWSCDMCTYLNEMQVGECEMCGSARPMRYTDMLSAEAQSREASVAGAAVVAAAGEAGEDTSGGASDGGKGGDSDTAWGFRLRVIPDLTKKGIEVAAQRHQDRIEELHEQSSRWTLRADEELIAYVNSLCARLDRDALLLNPEELNPTSEELLHYPALEGRKLHDVQMRFLMLRNFNGRLQDVLPLIDLDRDKHNAYLATLVRKLRALVLLPVKRVVWKRVVRVTETEQRPHVRTDRALARRFRESGRMDTRGRYTVFGQLMRQLRNVAPAQLRNPSRAFHVSFIGEFADDYGGPYREALVEMCEELQSSALPLLVPCPNGRADHGLNREKWTVNPAATTPACMAMWEFLGLLVGIALRTGNPLDLDLPSLVWKRLSGKPVTIGDVAAIDMQAAVRLRDIAHGVGSAGGQSPSREAWTRMARDLQLRFTARGGDGREVELVPGGREIPVTWERRAEYVSLVQRFRTTEGQAQCEAMLRGVATQVPMHLLSLFTWHEVEYMACGSATIDVDFLRENTEYGDGLDPREPMVRAFWDVLHGMSNAERALYLRFVWGRARLPATASELPRKHRINRLPKEDPNGYYPTSHTCFFAIDLPDYSSPEVLRQRLLYAITHCQAIDADDTTTAREAADTEGAWGGEADMESDEEEDLM